MAMGQERELGEQEETESLEGMDMEHYKGYFNEGGVMQRYEDPLTGAHFDYQEMCRRLRELQIAIGTAELSEEQSRKGSRDSINIFTTLDESRKSQRNLLVFHDAAQAQSNKNSKSLTGSQQPLPNRSGQTNDSRKKNGPPRVLSHCVILTAAQAKSNASS